MRITPLFSWFAIAAPLLLFAACTPASSPPPGPIKLTDLGPGRLEIPSGLESLDAPPQAVVLDEDFASGAGAWRSLVDPDEMLVPAGDELVIETGEPEEADGPRLRLSGRRGAVWRVVDAEAEAYFELRGLIRCLDLEPLPEPGYFGGSFYIAPLSASGPPEEIFARGLEAIALDIHQLPVGRGTTEWIEHRRVFRTPKGTRSLLIGCVLSVPVPLEKGSAEFRELTVARVDRRAHLEDLARIAVRERSPGDPVSADWRGERLVRANLGGQARPSVLGLPGETVNFRVTLPEGEARLEAGVGPWIPALADAAGDEVVFSVRVNGEEVLHVSRPVPARYLDARWHEISCDLARWAGKEVDLTLSVYGGLPGVWGAPIVRDAAAVSDKRNVVLVSIDTLRADHVHSYGYRRETTPNLDRLAAEGTRFTDCTTQSPYTLPSHVSIFSGQCPSVHGVQEAGYAISSKRTPMLAKLLSRHGWRTHAVTAGGYVSPVFGFADGFDAYSNIDPLRDDSSPHFAAMVQQQPDTISAELVREYGPGPVKEWITEHADEPFFLFLHTYAVHDFDPPPGYLERFDEPMASDLVDVMPYMDWRYITEHGISDEDLAQIVRHYDAALLYVDEVIGDLLDHLEGEGLRDKTIVVVTSDHGKELVERGIIGHGVTLYEEMVRVPLIIAGPGVPNGVVHHPVMSIDLAPTILSLLGLPPDPRMQGVDLFGGHLPRRTIWSEVVDPLAHKYLLREAEWKLIHDPQEFEVLFPSTAPWELFSLEDDPAEKTNLYETLPRDAERLSEALLRLRGRYEELGASLGRRGEGALDAETLAQLRALGYVND